MPNSSSHPRSGSPQKKTPAAARSATAVSSVSLPRNKRRRRLKRSLRLNRRFTGWEWLGFIASFSVSVFLVRSIALAESDHMRIQEQLSENRQQWDALERQRQEEEQRLTFLKSDEGRGQLLAERGYLKPGDRILLFPSEKTEDEEENTNGNKNNITNESKNTEMSEAGKDRVNGSEE